MVQESGPDKDLRLARVLDALAPRLETAKAALVAEIETRLTELVGVEVGEAFRAVAASQRHAARSMHLERRPQVGARHHRSRVDGNGDPRGR